MTTTRNGKTAREHHLQIQDMVPVYQETSHWTPVLIRDPQGWHEDLSEWFEARGLQRGDKFSRNDFLYPLSYLMLFKDLRVAVEFKLTWG